MHAASETLVLEKIEKRLTSGIIGRSSWNNELWDTIDSTNSRAAQLAAEGAPEGVIVLARQQTAGRGRLGRVWVSPPDAGIYLSVLLRPAELSPAELGLITLAIGVAVSSAIERCAGVKVGLKWVNDLVFEGRKVGGILAEMPSVSSKDSANKMRPVIVGIGLNLRFDESNLPPELAGRISSLEQMAGMPLDPNEVVAHLCVAVESIYETLKAKRTDEIISGWRARSVTLNQEVIATSGNTSMEGTAVDIDNSGALIIKLSDGRLQKLHAGEITIRAKDGSYA
jgi:BirA family biotin operon repressor/biotin-[acetyl-CoA-carboxylase] ligase